MVLSNILDGMESSSIINEAKHIDVMQKMQCMSAEQNTFTGTTPNTSSPPSSIETAGGTIAFQGNSQIAEAGTQANDVLSEAQSQRCRGESLVNEAHILNHEAMIARTKGDYVAADKLQREANALQKEGGAILENMNSGRDISFGGLSLSRCEKACAEKADGWRNSYIIGHW